MKLEKISFTIFYLFSLWHQLPAMLNYWEDIDIIYLLLHSVSRLIPKSSLSFLSFLLSLSFSLSLSLSFFLSFSLLLSSFLTHSLISVYIIHPESLDLNLIVLARGMLTHK